MTKNSKWMYLVGAGLAFGALAQSSLPPKAQFDADNKQALQRYDADKKLCNDEVSSPGRLQCRRDAKAEYDSALAQAKTRLTATGVAAAPVAAAPAPIAAAPCAECARVVAVSQIEKEGEGSAVGLLAGGAAGALLGRQLGGGMGKDLATIAGAVGGAYAGKKIEEKVKTHKVWTVAVQYPDNSRKSFDFGQDPGFKVGDAVKNSGSSLVRN